MAQQQVGYPTPPPKGTWRRALWQKWVRFESATALSMLEPWERVACLIASLLVVILFWASILTLYPRYISYLGRRFSYYVYDDESISTRAVVREWLKGGIRRGWRGFTGGVGGLLGAGQAVGGGVGGSKADL